MLALSGGYSEGGLQLFVRYTSIDVNSGHCLELYIKSDLARHTYIHVLACLQVHMNAWNANAFSY